MKKILAILSVLAQTQYSIAIDSSSLPIPFQKERIKPTSAGSQNPKAPVQIPVVYLEDYELTFATSCDGCTLQLVDETGDEVYSIIIPAETETLILPTDLTGIYELRLIRGNICFYGNIEL